MLNKITKKKMGRPMLSTTPKDVLIGARFGQDEARKVQETADKSDFNKSQWLRDTALEEARRPSPWVKSNFTLRELHNRTVEVKFAGPRHIEEWIGKFLVRQNPAGKLRIEVCIMTEATPQKAVLRRYLLGQYGADKIESHPNPEIAAFRLSG